MTQVIVLVKHIVSCPAIFIEIMLDNEGVSPPEAGNNLFVG
jgi:hypothetical protein